MSKRAFIVDIFKVFPKSYFTIENEVDRNNFEAYSHYKSTMDRKRAIDSNTHKIQENFDLLKKRLQLGDDARKR